VRDPIPAAPTAEDLYFFQHPLTRNGAYQLLPPSARARLHVLPARAAYNECVALAESIGAPMRAAEVRALMAAMD
jgi:hypothetical protein